jgi:uncharacterized ion transporter superfamily protein YfcC
MPLFKTAPSPIAVLMLVIVLSAAATWLIPAGEYNKLAMADASHFSVSTALLERFRGFFVRISS